MIVAERQCDGGGGDSLNRYGWHWHGGGGGDDGAAWSKQGAMLE